MFHVEQALRAITQSHNHSITQLHIACNRTTAQTGNYTNRQYGYRLIHMFHVEQRNRLLAIFNKEIFKNIWNVTKKVVSLQC